MTTLGWVALGALLGGIVAVALVIWLVTRFGNQVGEALRQWLNNR